jgi:hypothetical protein
VATAAIRTCSPNNPFSVVRSSAAFVADVGVIGLFTDSVAEVVVQAAVRSAMAATTPMSLRKVFFTTLLLSK